MQHFPDIDPAVAQPWLTVPFDWRSPDSGQQFTVLWDKDRDYGQLWPKPAPGEIAAAHQLDAYFAHTPTAAGHDENTPLGQRLQTKLSWFADHGVPADIPWWADAFGTKPLRVLEIGCGNGAHLTKLVSLGHAVIGIEPDPAARAAAQSAGHVVHDGDADALPDAIKGERFDAVIMMHVLENCASPAAAIDNAVQFLGDGGMIVVEVPNNACRGGAFYGPLWHWLDLPRHLNFFTTKSLTTLVNQAGLTVERTVYNGYCRQFSPGWKYFQGMIADAFHQNGDRRISEWAYWRYLLGTAFLPAARKYDSVRVVARVQPVR